MHHYQWAELKDFSGGMWTVQDWQIPPNGAALLEDCYSLPQGGLRAFGRWDSIYDPTNDRFIGNAGLSANEYPIGFHSERFPYRTPGPASAEVYLLMMWNPTSHVITLYYLDLTASATSWVALRTFSNGSSSAVGCAQFVSYQLASQPNAQPDVYFVLTTGGGTDNGLWRYRWSDNSVVRPTLGSGSPATTALGTPIAVHEDSLVVGGSGTTSSRLWFTNPGTETITATNFIDAVTSASRAGNVFFHSFAPSDLLVAKSGAPWVFVQEDLADPVVRTMSDVRHTLDNQVPTELEEGIAFMAYKDGIYATPDGSRFSKLSEPISQADLFTGLRSHSRSELGSIAYRHNWLVTPTGFIYDSRTKAWFKTSAWSTSKPAMHVIGTPLHPDNPSITAVIDPVDSSSVATPVQLAVAESGMQRVNSYRYQSPPMYDPTGRQVEFGEIDVICKAYANGASMDFTVNGVTRTIDNIGVGRQVVPALFRERDSQLDLTLRVRSNSTNVEAPSIEAIRIGLLQGHLIRVT